MTFSAIYYLLLMSFCMNVLFEVPAAIFCWMVIACYLDWSVLFSCLFSYRSKIGLGEEAPKELAVDGAT